MAASELKNYGFIEAGEWELKEHLKSGISFQLYNLGNERVVYAFLVGDNVNYIGICEKDITTLKKRMSRYKNMQGAGTNERIAGKIRDCLEHGKDVKIFALKTESPLQYKGLAVDLVKGLENPLIKQINPEWNIRK